MGNRDMQQTLVEQSPGRTILLILGSPVLRGAGINCFKSIFRNFFFLQYKAALLPGRVPVTSVDHPLDAKIPFIPRWVDIYLDFIAFWLRSLGFLLNRYGRRALDTVKDFICSMDRLYGFSAVVYAQNFSTTERPWYIARPRFLLIHLTDPHLMCIPSLHVMVVIRTYTKFREMVRNLGDEAAMGSEIEELRRGAVRITEAILHVKQHSVNCVAAAMYAMTRFDPPLFPRLEAEDFASRLFRSSESILPGDAAVIRNHIIDLYRSFLDDAQKTPDAPWEGPLLRFLQSLPQKGPYAIK
jgi:hypothetical protein